MNFSSSALSIARTRMCRTTARASRGEISSGGLWQRPQLVWNRFSPSVDDPCAVRVTFGFALLVELDLFAWALARADQLNKQRKAVKTDIWGFIWILQAKAETRIGM
jgi:hypothetical protein